MPINVHFTAGDGKGWAIDEDLRQIRMALSGLVRESSPASASVIHAAYWGNLFHLPAFLLREKFVIVHADNPPFYSIKQVEFANAQRWVDLWVARSTEAAAQFKRLGLPVQHIPYTIDPSLFFPIPDKSALRQKYGIPTDAYVIANFHRDSEGADLSTPKFQKAPELMLEILRRLHLEGLPVHTLIAGPRRHWIRHQLKLANIPHTFVGKDTGNRDDFGVNILSRSILNELYNAANLYLIPSRWEGGPQSAMEAVACRIPTLSTPVGVARDILSPSSLFRTADEAVQRIREAIHGGSLQANVPEQFERWQENHTTETLTSGLAQLYQNLPSLPAFERSIPSGKTSTSLRILGTRLLNRWDPPKPANTVSVVHQEGHHPILDQLIRNLRHYLSLGHAHVVSTGAEASFCGYIPDMPLSRHVHFQIYSPELPTASIHPGTIVVCASVADALHFHGRNLPLSFIVLPLLDDNRALPDPTSQPDSPLVVTEVTPETSHLVWEALIRKQAVAFPEDSFLFEQIFHGGLSFPHPEMASDTATLIRKDYPSFQHLIRVPNQEETLTMLERLLRLPSLR